MIQASTILHPRDSASSGQAHIYKLEYIFTLRVFYMIGLTASVSQST